MGLPQLINSASEEVVLIVDDEPANLAMLHDALDEAGYMVLVATDGESALQRARQGQAKVVLLDALMPGMDGFEVCRRLKADFMTRHIPVIFMTGLTESEHVVAAFEAGSSDYVTKPVRPAEVLVRIAAHIERERMSAQARVALDAFGQATIAVRLSCELLIWKTPLAREMLQRYFDSPDFLLPGEILSWLRQTLASRQPGQILPNFYCVSADKRLVVTIATQTDDDEWLLVLREESDVDDVERLMQAFSLTLREAQVLQWIVKGKTSRDIGQILGSSHRTVDKHLERIYLKLGVETRTAAASMAIEKIRLAF